ncbi:MAG: RluA family pseudouridine synthase [Bacteriovoracaceae bacterium]|nr:RluA family pseudouridine synthase [Bacteriovoracaceae bacterium]
MIKDLEQRIIYENENVLVVNKPYNLPSTGRSLDDDDCLQFWLIKRHGGMVWAIHQLDADTSGVNIFVTEKKLVSIYKKSLEKMNANKEYLVIVHGVPDWNECEEFGPIGKIDDHSLGIHPEGKSAHSKFTVIKRGENHTFLKAQIFTGRTHQIRIHLSHLGHPVVGDDWYCKPPCQEHIRQALHCHKIHLLSSNELFTAPLPLDLEELIVKFNINE